MSAKSWEPWKDSLYLQNINAAFAKRDNAPEPVLNAVIDTLQALAMRRHYKNGRHERAERRAA